MPTVLQLIKRYSGNAPLLNNMISRPESGIRTVVCYLSGEPDGNNAMDDIAAHTEYCQLAPKSINWTRPSTLRAVAALIDQHNADLVVCQMRRMIPLGVMAGALATRSPQVIGVLHGIVGGRVGALRKLINFFVYRRLARLVSVSETGVGDILQHNPALDRAKVVAVPNGIDCRPFLAPSPITREQLWGEFGQRRFVFVMVGRLAPVKNHRKVLLALQQLAKQRNDVRLAVVGSGPLNAELKALARELNLDQHVWFTGRRTDVPDILQHADCYLMPSLREGLPLALMEAMASGCCVITSRVKGMGELVPDEKYGYWVEPESVASIVHAMQRAVTASPEQRAELGRNARQRILDNYTAEHMAARYEKLYRDILKDSEPVGTAS